MLSPFWAGPDSPWMERRLQSHPSPGLRGGNLARRLGCTDNIDVRQNDQSYNTQPFYLFYRTLLYTYSHSSLIVNLFYLCIYKANSQSISLNNPPKISSLGENKKLSLVLPRDPPSLKKSPTISTNGQPQATSNFKRQITTIQTRRYSCLRGDSR